jgi:hypothetical protein
LDAAATHGAGESLPDLTLPGAIARLGMKTVGNDRKNAPPLSLSHFFIGNESDTILPETKTASVFR